MIKLTHLYHIVRARASLNNVVLVGAGLIVLVGAWNTVGTLQKNFVLQQKVDDLDRQIEIAQLEVETNKLEQQYLKSDEYLELSARKYLGKAAPGEHLITLPPAPTTAKKATATSSPTKPVETSNLELWRQFFFGR